MRVNILYGLSSFGSPLILGLPQVASHPEAWTWSLASRHHRPSRQCLSNLDANLCRFGTYLSPRRGSRESMGLLTRFASQWVAGETLEDALRVAKDANRRGIDALVNHLGEHYREKGPVEATSREYLRLVSAMRDQGIRAHVSLKPTPSGLLMEGERGRAQRTPLVVAAKDDGRVMCL